MNDLQKKLLIVGLTAFIVWFFLAMGNDAFEALLDGEFKFFVGRGIFYSPSRSGLASWPHLITFMTWIGSLVAFNVYKD